MKRVIINAPEVGLVFKRGAFLRMLTQGIHWTGWAEEVKVYDITLPFTAPCELNMLLQNNELADALHVTEVKHTELVLLYRNGVFTEILPAGRYTYWKGPVQYEFIRADISKPQITEPIGREVLTNAQMAKRMGLTVNSFGVRDVILPGDIKEIMNQVLVAEKRAQANIIMRREETASARSLLNTAKLMEDNQMLFRLKEMEYVEKIADKISTISVGSNGMLLDQLKQIFATQK